jgi:hypothetical protein
MRQGLLEDCSAVFVGVGAEDDAETPPGQQLAKSFLRSERGRAAANRFLVSLDRARLAFKLALQNSSHAPSVQVATV